MMDGNDERVCRVCRLSAPESGQELYQPCKCSGSIQHVHEDCLRDWLAISRGHKCELCKQPFRWQKVYAAQAPSRLPPLIILRHVVLTLLACVRMVARVLLVGFVWLAALPYSVLWAWRGFFHLGKSWGVAWNAVAQEADWSRMALSSLLLPRAPKGASASDTDAAMKQLAQSVADLKATWEAMASRASGTPGKDAVHVHSMSTTGHLVSSSLRPRITSLDEVFRDFMRVWHRPADIPHAASASPSASVAPSLPAVVVNLAAEAVVDAEQHATTLPRAFAWRLLMAQHEYINEVVHGFWHRHQDTLQIMAKDCFSGQIIVCCVVVAFIAAFLLREWVLSNQPLAEGEPMPANGAGAAPGNLPLALPPPLLQDPPAENVDAIPDATEALAGESRPRTRPGSPWPREALDAADLEAEEDAELDDTKMKSASSDAVEAQAGPSSEGAQAFLQRQRERNASTHSSVPAGQAFPAGNPPQQDGQFRFQFSVEDGELQNQDGSDQVVQAGAARSDDEWVDADDVQDEEQPAFGPAPQSAVQGGPAALAPAAVRPDPAAVAAVNQRARRRAVRRQRRRLGLPEDPRDFGESDSSDSEFEDDPFNMGRRPGEAVNDAAANELADPRAADRAIGGIAPDEQAAIDALRDEEEMFWEADLEGIMEAVGLRGPLIALLQNVGLMTLLVTSLLAVAVWMPLMLGKTVVATNAYRLAFLPINLVRLITDPVADRLVALLGNGKAKLVTPQPPVPARTSWIAAALSLLTYRKKKPEPTFVQWTIQQVRFVANRYRESATNIVETAGRIGQLRWRSMATDDGDIERILCVALGYALVIAGAAAYLRYTHNVQARNASRVVREAVQQHFVMVKAALFFLVEIVLFPTICGCLLNFASIPFFPGASIASRRAYLEYAPITGLFLTWLGGTLYMYAFAQCIATVRRCLRKGALFIIRDPTHPDTNPLREILDTPAHKQAQKIGRSLLIYGAVILACFGALPWLARYLDFGLFPLRWNMTQPISAAPFDLIFVLLVMPFTIGKTRPKRVVRELLSQWIALTSHQLRLSSYMLGRRQQDEEGTHIRKSWRDWLLCKRAASPQSSTAFAHKAGGSIDFVKDGEFRRVPAIDGVKIVQKRMFITVNEDGTPIDEDGAKGIKAQLEKGNVDTNFTVVYVPPHFKTRILLFIYLLGFTGSLAIFSCIATPLLVGRFVLDRIVNEPLHDTYSILVGLHTILTASYIRSSWQQLASARGSPSPASFHWNRQNASKAFVRYGQAALLLLSGAVLLPFLVGAVLHVFVIAPLDTPATELPSLSMSMCWCYGALACSLMLRVLPVESLNLFRIPIQTHGLIGAAPELNRRIGIVNLRLAMGLALPGLVTLTHLQITKCILILSGKSGAAAAISTSISADSFGSVYGYKVAVLSMTVVTTVLMLLPHARYYAQKWASAVFEREYVVKRKLLNIGDPATPNEEAHPPAV